MTSMQKQSSLISGGKCFDMWRDYMNLGRMLEKLGDGIDMDRRDTEGPVKQQRGHIQVSRWVSRRDSAETSSVSSSSLSDTSCNGTSSDYCRFCKHNGESSRVYRSHKLKSEDGKVVCPILWNYTCPICEATGDHAHTRRYCPLAQQQEAARVLPAGSRLW
ncbi:nanos homolog 2-like [Aulostomus maculatus]